MQQGHLKIWQVSDGKPGHVNQAMALIDALADLRHIEHSVLPAWPWRKAVSALFRPKNSDASHPGLVIGVGHSTHLTVLALQRQLGARSAVIMNPSLPARLFDAVITPRHDGFTPGGNRLVTPLSLAPVPAASAVPDYGRGLILLGGDSRHFEWHNEDVIQQMNALAERYTAVQWQATTSRRTPTDFITAATSLPRSIELLDWASLPGEWLQQALPAAGHIWVTEDSASMLAEAMNTQACVGLIKLVNTQKENKLRRGTSVLEREGRLATLARPYTAVEDSDSAPTDPACGRRDNPNIVCAQSLLALLDL